MRRVRMPRTIRGRSLVCLAAVCLLLACAATAVAQEATPAEEATPELISAPVTSPNGVYAVVGTTNTGKNVSANVLVTEVGGDSVQFKAKVMGVPVTTTGPGTWNAERTVVTVPVSVYIWGVVDASASITLSAADDGWNFNGSGQGTAMGKSGSATAAGFMPGGVAPTVDEQELAGAPSQGAQAADDALSALQPAEEVGDLDSDALLAELAVILFAVFFLIMLQMILRVEVL